jgi:DNA-binding transcriptional MerR regulator
MDRELLNSSQAADTLGVTRSALSMWRQRGIGPRFYRIGSRRVFYRRTDILAFIRGLSTQDGGKQLAEGAGAS